MRMKKGEASRFPFPLKPGAGDESRTRDLNLGKVALYQLSYSRIFLTEPTPSQRDNGAGDESRTRDLNLGKVALYQLSYSRIRPAKDLNFTQFFGIGKSTLPKKNEKYHKHGIRRSFFRRFQAIRGGRAPLARPYSDRPPSLRLSQPSGRRAHACARACR